MNDSMFISLDEAAHLECLKYKTLNQRIQRALQKKSNRYEVKYVPREGGGKPQILVAIASLTYSAQKAYKAAHPEAFPPAEPTTDNASLTATRPWYVDQSYFTFIHQHREEWENAQTVIDAIDSYLKFKNSALARLSAAESSVTNYVAKLAAELNMKQSTFYKKVDELATARAWDEKLTAETGKSHIYIQRMALCRKPVEKNKFPSMSEPLKVLARCVVWDKVIAENNTEFGGLPYQIFSEQATELGLAPIPSVDTFKSFVKYEMDKNRGEQAYLLARNQLKEFRRTTTIKTRRSTKGLMAMEYVETDGHTFDLFVSVVGKNGKLMAVRPSVVAFIDVKTRMILGDTVCIHSNAQVVKEAACRARNHRRHSGCIDADSRMEKG